MKFVVNKLGFGRVAKNNKTTYIKNLAVSSRHTIAGSFDIYRHMSNNNNYMLKSFDLPISLSIFIEYTQAEIIKSYIYKDGTKIINKVQLTTELI